MAAKKKTSKKTPAKSAKTSKSAPATKKASARRVAESDNVSILEAAGVIDSSELGPDEQAAINERLSSSDVQTMISVFGKLGGTPKTRARVQLCF
jgi:hypothetical protein